jgi:hypothetical protein
MKIALRFKDNQPLANWLSVINQLKREFKKESLDGLVFTANIQQLRKPKTFSQLRYFHCDGFIGRIIQGYREAGYDVPMGKEEAKEWTKNEIKLDPAIMFVTKHPTTDGRDVYIPKSFSKATKEEMSHIIDWCMRTYQTYFGIVLESVHDYKKRMNLK